jgi:hypothetical protein
MKVIIDRHKINMRAQASNIASVGGLTLLLASVILPLFLPAASKISLALMIAGMGIAMVGIYFANRWVRKPRPEESLGKALKSFDDQYRLYHYPSLPCDHVLLTPAGLVILDVINLNGFFSYKNGRWREAMTIGRALRYIVEERLGDPVRAAQQVADFLRDRLTREFAEAKALQIKSVIVFTHPGVELEIEGAPITVCKIDKLKKSVPLSVPRISPQLYEKISSFLERATLG